MTYEYRNRDLYLKCGLLNTRLLKSEHMSPALGLAMVRRFDVFLAHNSLDKPLIRKLYRKLRERGLSPWLDEEEITPGQAFQDEIQRAIGQVKTAAVCIGKDGLGRWQALELKIFISQCIEQGIPVIPVLLPGVDEIPKHLLFLQEFHHVIFKDCLEDAKALGMLEWGVTGRKPQMAKSNRLNNSIGEVSSDSQFPQMTLSSEDQKADKSLGKIANTRSINYRRLDYLLRKGDWAAADYETLARMAELLGYEAGDFIRDGDLIEFPDTDLKIIDQLWLQYSERRFGFSVQRKLYQECGAKLDGKYPGDKIWDQFHKLIGWRKNGRYIYYSQVTFNISAPMGHLPTGDSGRGVLSGFVGAALLSNLALRA